jgi:hypothetical protein
LKDRTKKLLSIVLRGATARIVPEQYHFDLRRTKPLFSIAGHSPLVQPTEVPVVSTGSGIA